MSIKYWPHTERPREKLLQQGAKSLSSAELLAILLGTGYKNKSAVEVSYHLLQHFGGLRPLFNANTQEMYVQTGIGPAKYARLQASIELARRYLGEHLENKPLLQNPKSTQEYLKAHIRDYSIEVFCCLYLNTRHQVIYFEELSKGTLYSTHVYPREIIQQALKHHASAIIVAHNHPSGNSTPSQADKTITHTLKTALALFEIQLLDHIIIADNQAVSFMELGLL